nr:metallophosphatase [uncultured Flavobacterium sp.]
MKRRDFIQKTAVSSAFITLGGLSLSSFSNKKTKRITILHTNDTHSHIDAFPADHSKYPNMGGAARRAAYINKIREENPNTLLFDAGDMFQGTPYFNYYGGELEIKIMNLLKYDAATLGNHEFDNGLEGLAAQLPNADFDIINSNYDFSNTIINGLTKPYKIFEVDGIKIGVIGLGVKLEGLVNKREYGETKYLDPIDTAKKMTNVLKNKEKCDIVICLSHLGYAYDKNINPENIGDLDLAALTQDIDLIIGGHTHTFLEKPTIVKNIIGEEVIVNQAGCFGLRIGQIDLFFDDKKLIDNSARNIEI